MGDFCPIQPKASPTLTRSLQLQRPMASNEFDIEFPGVCKNIDGYFPSDISKIPTDITQVVINVFGNFLRVFQNDVSMVLFPFFIAMGGWRWGELMVFKDVRYAAPLPFIAPSGRYIFLSGLVSVK